MINMREIAAEYRLSHWASVIQDRNASGMSIKTYCKSINVRPNVYFYWQRKLREAACQEMHPAAISNSGNTKTPNSLPTRVPALPMQVPTWAVCEVSASPSTPASSEVTIEIGKSRVTANTGADLEYLSNVCRMLMTLC